MRRAPRRPTLAFIALGLLTLSAVAVLGARVASQDPDGFTKVAAERGLDRGETEHALADGPLADYRVSAVENDGVASGLAIVIGLIITFAICVSALFLARRKRAGQ